MKIVNPKLENLFSTVQRKSYTVMAISAVVIGLFVVFSIRPTFLKIAQLRREIEDKEEFLQKADSKLTTLTSLIEEARSVSTETEFFDQIFAEENKDGFIVANLDAISRQYNIILSSVEFAEPEESGEAGTEAEVLPENTVSSKIRISIYGDKISVKDFIEYLEGFPMIFNIKSVSYTERDYSSDSERDEKLLSYPLEVGVEIEYYYWSEPVIEEETPVENVENIEEMPTGVTE